MLQSRIDRLNVVLNRPSEAWTRNADGKLTANIGHFLLDSYSPGDGWTRYTLAVICSDGGGQSNASPTCTAQEMWTYLRGVFDVLDSEYTHQFDKAGQADAVRNLAQHVLAMESDSYLSGHPEWEEIVSDAKKAGAK